VNPTIDLFMQNAPRVGAHAIFAENREQLASTLLNILADEESVYFPCISDLEKTLAAGCPRRVNDYFGATATVEEATAAIAETGTIVSTSAKGRPVQATLLPAHHVALVSRTNVFQTVDDFFASCMDPLPANITLITGPSRTADIELTLTVGVHGPKRVDIIVF